MRKHLIILFGGLMLSHFILGQQIYFNDRYNLGTCSGGDGEGILDIPGGYLVFGPTFKDVACSYGRYCLFNIDSLGNIKWEKDYGSTKFSYVTGTGSLISTNDGKYAACGWVIDTTFIKIFGSYDADLVLYKFNANGDTEWIKTYVDTNTYVEGVQCKQTKDGGYVITGLYGDTVNPSYSYVFLLKTDSVGNEQWQKTYSAGYRLNWGYSVDITSDGGYIIGGGATKEQLLETLHWS